MPDKVTRDIRLVLKILIDFLIIDVDPFSCFKLYGIVKDSNVDLTVEN